MISVQKKNTNRIFSATDTLILVFDSSNKIELMTSLECQNDTNTSVDLELWFLEVVLGLMQMGKEPVNRQCFFLISKELFIMVAPKLFMMTKLSLTNLI